MADPAWLKAVWAALASQGYALTDDREIGLPEKFRDNFGQTYFNDSTLRHDPGDMDKYLIRLEVKNNQLYLTFRVPEDAADPDDPDVTKTPLLDGNAATCNADALTNPPWSPWRTYVFDRDEKK